MLGRGRGQDRGFGGGFGRGGQRGAGRGSPLTSLVNGAVSIVAEYRAHRKDVTKAPATTVGQTARERSVNPPVTSVPRTNLEDNNCDSHADPPPYGSYDERLYLTDSDAGHHNSYHDSYLMDDETIWDLDAANSSAYDRMEAGDDEGVDDRVQSNHPAIMFEPRQPLPCPVIIPQRRPRDKKRGFVRAYAPVLGPRDIDQTMFLKFLKDFHKSSQASPIFPVIQVAAGIASFAPSLIATAVCMSVQVVATVGAEAQSRQRTNTFLDKANAELFQPRGLYALIMKYKPVRPDGDDYTGIVQAQAVDMRTHETIAKYMPTDEAKRSLADRMKKFRASSGTTRGALDLPEAAPLVFPELDSVVTADGEETLKDRAHDAKKFVNNYLDRRAQRKFATSDPDSTLNLPTEQVRMRSALAERLSDNNAVDSSSQHRYNGHPRQYETGPDSDRWNGSGYNGPMRYSPFAGGMSQSQRGTGGSGRSPLGNMMQGDVLYLLIVDMPSEAELNEARQIIS